MEVNVLKRTDEFGSKFAKIGEEASCLKEKMAEAVEDGVETAERALRRARRSAEDAIDSATYQIKRHPLQSVGITLGIGLVCGLVVGWLAGRNRS